MYVLFKHKWKIVLISLLSLGGAAVYYLKTPAPYISESKLMVIYVKDSAAIDQVESTTTTAGSRGSDSVIKSELEILTSWDLAKKVVDDLGADRVVPKGVSPREAVSLVATGLAASAEKGSSVIHAAFTHPDPETAAAVLKSLVENYFVMHGAIHRSARSLEKIKEERNKSSTRLGNLETDLKNFKNGSSLSLSDLLLSYDAERAKAKSELDATEVELAQQKALLAELEKFAPVEAANSSDKPATAATQPEPEKAAAAPDSAVIGNYQALRGEIAALQDGRNKRLTVVTRQSDEIKKLDAQIKVLEDRRTEMEKKNPYLVAVASTPSATPGSRVDMPTERAKLASLGAKYTGLQSLLNGVEGKILALNNNSTVISTKERERDSEKKNFDHLSASVVKAEADSMALTEQTPGIAVVQQPTPGAKDTKLRNQILAGMVAGGPVLGIAAVLLFGLILNRKIKRSLEVEEAMGMPLMMTIPFFSRRQRLLARRPMGMTKTTKLLEDSELQKAPWEQYHFIRPFAEAIRDRLGAYFDARGNHRKPKLIAVTGYGVGAGTSTLAAGLAASMSETGDGKVLLVDMNGSHSEAHPFFDGQPSLSLTKALRLPGGGVPSREPEAPGENLFLARADAPAFGGSSAGLRRMMPELKASDFDYVIFDMPPLGQTKPTATLAGLMDKTLVIVEAEANNRSDVRRGYRELMDAGADVSMVFNKAKFHGPKAILGGV